MSADVLRLQKALLREGYDPGPLDGQRGAKTQAALEAWQQARLTWPTGVDVSKWQPQVDWAAVKGAGASFAICKGTQGGGRDSLFATHWPAIKAAGLIRCTYHWFSPATPLLTQADTIYKAVGKLQPGDLPVALDIERDSAGADGQEGTADDIKATDQMAEELAKLVLDRTGKVPLIYSYSYYLAARNIEVPNCPLWIADYRSGPPTLPPGWTQYAIHQYAGDSGRHPGVTGPCDLNRFRGSLGDLRAMAGL